MADSQDAADIRSDYQTQYGFSDPEKFVFKARKGLDRELVEGISRKKGEPDWMREFRLDAYERFLGKPMPSWGDPELLNRIDFREIYYYLKPSEGAANDWKDVPEYIKNTFEKLGIPEAEKKFLAGVTAQYECLSSDSLVYTSKGVLPIREIQPGMEVWSLDESRKSFVLQKVKAVLPKGKRKVHEVSIGGRRILCTLNHPFLALTHTKTPGRMRGKFGTQWRYLQDLGPGDYVAIAKRIPSEGASYKLPKVSMITGFRGRNQVKSFPVVTENYFNRMQKSLRLPETTSSPFLWFLGAYIGDGFVHRSRRSGEKCVVDIAFPDSEPEMRHKLAGAPEEVFGYKIKSDNDPYRVRVHSIPIVKFLAEIGLDAHAYTKSMPAWVFNLPKEERLAFIGGYIDSDGYLRNGNRNSDAVITSVNRKLLKQVQQLSISCGIQAAGPFEFASRSTYKGITTTRKAFRLILTGDLTPLTEHSLKCRAFVPRKYSHTFNTGPNDSPLDHWTSEELGFARIRSIKPAGDEEVYDIEVEGHHNFVAEGIVVHNSEAVYHSLHEELSRHGVIFLDMDSGLREHPDLVRKYFGTLVPPGDNKFAALNSAVWSGGSFVYVPKGVKVAFPIQAYFRINARNAGQFERTLIVADEGSSIHYIEGCLPEGEWVSLGDTFSAIEDVRPGMKTLNSLGEEAVVRATRKRPYAGDLVRLVPVSVGNAFELTPEHPVWTIQREKASRRRNNRPKSRWDILHGKLLKAEACWVPAGDVQVGDLLCFPIASKVLDHPEISDDLLRLLGYYLAEGSAFFNGKTGVPTVTLSFNIKERDKIEEAKRLMTLLAGKPAREFQVPEKHESRVYIYSQELLALSRKYCGRHAAFKRLHGDIMELPAARQSLLLETYLKGDGSRHKRSNGNTLIRASTVSKVLAFQIQEILARNGIYAGIQVRQDFHETMPSGREIHHREAYSIHFEEGLKVHQVWKDERRNCFWVPVRSIHKRPYQGRVYNLEMETAPNAYLARGFAVHNCTAPSYSVDSLHAAVVEVIALKGAHIRYTTIQNWSNNVYNLVTKRAVVHEDAFVEWVDGNLGSKLTMKYPALHLVGRGARGEVLTVAFAGKGQHQDTGAKLIFAAPHTSGTITSKSISKDGGRASYRGLVKVLPGVGPVKANVRCDALLLDESSRSDTYPTMEIGDDRVQVEHEASVSKIGEEQLFYLMSRGLKESEAVTMIVNGFFEAFAKELPMEYSVELNRLLQLEMEGAVG